MRVQTFPRASEEKIRFHTKKKGRCALREGLHTALTSKTAEAIDESTALLNNWLLGWRKVNGSFTNSVYMQIAKQLLKHNDHLHIFMR
jgi:hypothetical protein